MILSREAVEAADDAYCRATGSRMAYALAAALPYLLAAKDAEIAALRRELREARHFVGYDMEPTCRAQRVAAIDAALEMSGGVK